MNQYNICPNCFNQLTGPVCRCGFDPAKQKRYSGVLPQFFILNGRYMVGRVLGKGGFGVTYKAKDLATNQIYAVKEYMPAEHSSRNTSTYSVIPYERDVALFEHGRKRFSLEAKTLKDLRKNPFVVNIYDEFIQNNTAYFVMEYLDGKTLLELAKMNGGKLDPEFAKTIFVTVASALIEIHNLGILHRDLSPENIMITGYNPETKTFDNITLIDFGAARSFVSLQNKGMSVLLKPGYAPPEQYNSKGNHGPWCDVYALCATFFRLVSGKSVTDAQLRLKGVSQPTLRELGCPVTPKTSEVIEKGMAMDYRRRYRDFKQLLDEIDLASSNSRTDRDIVRRTNKIPVNDSEYNWDSEDPSEKNRKLIESAPVVEEPRRKRWWASRNSVKVTPPSDNFEPEPNEVERTEDKRNNVNSVSSSKQNGVPPTTPGQNPQPLYIATMIRNSAHNKRQIPVCGAGNSFKIGRSELNSHYIVGSSDTNVSRMHCRLIYDGERLYIIDESANGTFFENGEQLVKNQRYELKPGVKFYLATRNHMLVVLQ